ncbi:MAG: hypothetical protein HYW01_11965 [Deltaproteobacteria bacterium]|nr:hypothetical protein [Deltaproteobacteria bacterium]
MEKDKIVKVHIFAFPIEGCDESKTWRAASEMIARRLGARYGDRVQTEFIEIFSPEAFNYPEILELIEKEQALPPIVTVEGKVIHSGGKLSERIIRNELDKLGIPPAHLS